MRFEIVPAPIEERLQSTLQTQVLTLLSSARSIATRADVHRSRLSSTLSDEAFVARVATNAAALALPSSLPGALLVAALMLKLTRFAALRLLARRAVRRAAVARRELHEKSS
jgi:hypothetical protein